MRTAVVAAALLCLAGAAQAQDIACGEKDQMLVGIREKLGAMPLWRGQADGGSSLELWVQPNGTWALVVMSGRAACIASTGTASTELQPPADRPAS